MVRSNIKHHPPSVGTHLCRVHHPATISLSGLLTAMVWAGDTDPYNGETEAQRALAHSGKRETRANARPMPQGLCQTQLPVFH